ncbi:GNAT family N-acetyltransferase [Campylobacter sp. 19-13652]|uniref:GNAT family N-acetyltransferase n=1 Tax=Campylobacter sp. 19-13652 TaxID=2840180 RepID=UPI001C74C178|nr:GNAT family N-acetyltransferase [Campylobacter sp. 19-13652]BCX79218.1 GNAT family N-acetyltransferase [Campylobacter sp. 19-13652]
MQICLATASDAGQIAQIYSYYVKNTAITFDYEAPDESAIGEQIKATLRQYPFIVAKEQGRVVGYAYASKLKNRQAYDWAVESSIYLPNTHISSGIGSALYDVLEGLLRAQGVASVFACIAAGHELEQSASILFHARRGFSEVGRWLGCGFKFNRWYDVIWMQKQLCDPGDSPKEPKPILELEARRLSDILGGANA